MSLDNEKLIPNKKQRNWLAGQAHIIQRDGLLVIFLKINNSIRNKLNKKPSSMMKNSLCLISNSWVPKKHTKRAMNNLRKQILHLIVSLILSWQRNL